MGRGRDVVQKEVGGSGASRRSLGKKGSARFVSDLREADKLSGRFAFRDRRSPKDSILVVCIFPGRIVPGLIVPYSTVPRQKHDSSATCHTSHFSHTNSLLFSH